MLRSTQLFLSHSHLSDYSIDNMDQPMNTSLSFGQQIRKQDLH